MPEVAFPYPAADVTTGNGIADNGGVVELDINNITTSKVTPVGADVVPIADSASAYATKKATLASLPISTEAQSALDGKEKYGEYNGIVTETTTARTFALTDKGKLVETTNAGLTTLTVPPNSSVAFPIGSRIDVICNGAGGVNFAAGVGVTIRSKAASLNIIQYVGASLVKRATNEWNLVGGLT